MRNLVVLAMGLTLATFPAFADDWQATRLRGQVLQLVDGAWRPLHRGDIIPDDRVIRTLHLGAVQLVRGAEILDLGPDTQIQIFDRGGAKPFTTVRQAFGTVSVEAEVRAVQHFSVETPTLAAVVKGTRFTVTSGVDGASVSVARGHVQVDDALNDTHVKIAAGQAAAIDTRKGASLAVAGTGMLPQVVDARGKPVGPASSTSLTLADLRALAKTADTLAHELKTPEAKAAAEAAKVALKAAEEQAKSADKAAKAAADAAQKAQKHAAKDEKGKNDETGGKGDKPKSEDKPKPDDHEGDGPKQGDKGKPSGKGETGDKDNKGDKSGH